jgi:2,5-diamino-6-(ribosylamino)-4(3H)-pyrimidinone 5'-phosphate reductase
MLPRVILHNAVSLDGRIEGFPVDMQQYYGLAASFGEDATLAGADTFLSAEKEAPPEDESAFLPPRIEPEDRRPVLVIPDSRGRIRTWNYLRALPYWRDFIALCSRRTPPEYLQYLEKRHIHFIIAGEDHVDISQALERLASDYGVRVVRVDAGGTLNGQLLRLGLVDEVSVLVCPFLVGSAAPKSIFRAAEGAAQAGRTGKEDAIALRLKLSERLPGDVVRLHYEVVR